MYFELNEHTREILGMPNFQCGPIAHLLRDYGGKDIEPKSEAEQAFVLHWLLGFYESHGPEWRKAAAAAMSEIMPKG